MVKPLMLINVVGLTSSMLGPHSPHLTRLANEGFACPMDGVFPAVTCTAQASMLTGVPASGHGVVANGWYVRDLAEIMFWKQSNHLVRGEKLYETVRKRAPGVRSAKMFWWYNMYAPVDFSMTPRPSYPADGRKIFDSYSEPAALRDELQSKLGVFPLQYFWGPVAGIPSSRWIADASKILLEREHPELMLVYLPHLDYNLQRLGPNDPRIAKDIALVDAEAGKLIEASRAAGYKVMVVSEYGITDVSRPIAINRVLREAGYLRARREPLGWETLDAGASRAFAVADHQIAHVYVQRPEDVTAVRSLLERTPGIERVLDRVAQAAFGIDHERSGELVAISSPEAWFTYYFWLDDAVAPDYARTIDIHRKPGYDPMEMLVDPKLAMPKLRMARRLLQKKLGFRYYMDVIGLDASPIRGSHGRLATPGKEADEAPLLICSDRRLSRDRMSMLDVKSLALEVMGLAN